MNNILKRSDRSRILKTFWVNVLISTGLIPAKTMTSCAFMMYTVYTFIDHCVFCCSRTSSVVWMRETWQTARHLWSLARFSALNSQSWPHHHPQPWSMGKAPSRYRQTHVLSDLFLPLSLLLCSFCTDVDQTLLHFFWIFSFLLLFITFLVGFPLERHFLLFCVLAMQKI